MRKKALFLQAMVCSTRNHPTHPNLANYKVMSTSSSQQVQNVPEAISSPKSSLSLPVRLKLTPLL